MSFVYQAIQVPFRSIYSLVTTFVSSSNTNQPSLDIDNHIVNVKNNKSPKPEQLEQKPYFLRPKKQVSYVT